MTEAIQESHATLAKLRAEVAKVVIGQDAVVNRLVIALLIRGQGCDVGNRIP